MSAIEELHIGISQGLAMNEVQDHSRADELERMHDYLALKRAVGTLDERKRSIVLLRYGAGMSRREIADVYSLSVPRIHQIEQRALRELRHPSRSQPIRGIDKRNDCGISDAKEWHYENLRLERDAERERIRRQKRLAAERLEAKWRRFCSLWEWLAEWDSAMRKFNCQARRPDTGRRCRRRGTGWALVGNVYVRQWKRLGNVCVWLCNRDLECLPDEVYGDGNMSAYATYLLKRQSSRYGRRIVVTRKQEHAE